MILTPAGKTMYFREEDILWEGKPKKKSSVFFLEQDYYHDVMTGPASMLTILLFFFLLFFYAFYKAGHVLGMTFVLFAFLFCLFLPDVILRYKRRKTRYAVTKDFVLFQTVKWFRPRITAIHISDIRKITYQAFADNTGIVKLYGSGLQRFGDKGF